MTTATAPAPRFQRNQQAEFLARGGIYKMILEAKYDSGELLPPEHYVHQDYPKALNVRLGIREIPRSTEAIRGGQLIVREWIEKREVVADLIVADKAEETATLEAVRLAREMGLEIDPEWNAETLRWTVKQAALHGVPLHLAVEGTSAPVTEPATVPAATVLGLEQRLAEALARLDEREAADATQRKRTRTAPLPEAAPAASE
jgi:hypothetical protein